MPLTARCIFVIMLFSVTVLAQNNNWIFDPACDIFTPCYVGNFNQFCDRRFNDCPPCVYTDFFNQMYHCEFPNNDNECSRTFNGQPGLLTICSDNVQEEMEAPTEAPTTEAPATTEPPAATTQPPIVTTAAPSVTTEAPSTQTTRVTEEPQITTSPVPTSSTEQPETTTLEPSIIEATPSPPVTIDPEAGSATSAAATSGASTATTGASMSPGGIVAIVCGLISLLVAAVMVGTIIVKKRRLGTLPTSGEDITTTTTEFAPEYELSAATAIPDSTTATTAVPYLNSESLSSLDSTVSTVPRGLHSEIFHNRHQLFRIAPPRASDATTDGNMTIRSYRPTTNREDSTVMTTVLTPRQSENVM